MKLITHGIVAFALCINLAVQAVYAQEITDKQAMFLKKIELMPKRMLDGRELVDTTFREIVIFSILSNNNLEISLYNIKRAAYTIQQSAGSFDPKLTLKASASQKHSPTTFAEPKETFSVNRSNTVGYEIGIEQMLPIGVTYSVNLGTNEYDPKSSTLTADDYKETVSSKNPIYHNNYLGFNLNIPLFKLGNSNLTDVNIATENVERAKYTSIELVHNIIMQIGNLYYNFYGLYQQYEAQKIRLAHSRQLLNEARTRFELGAADRIKMKETESLVEIDTQNLKAVLYRIIEFDNIIKQALKLEHLEYGIYPIENLQLKPFEGDLATLIENTYQNDPKLKQYEKDRKINRYRYEQLDTIDNPDVSLNLNYTLNSYGFTKSQATDHLGKNKTDNYSVALSWNIPLGNNVNESLLQQSLIDTEQTNIRVNDRKNAIRLNLRQMINNLDLLVQEEKTRKISINLSQEVLDREQEKNRLGSGTIINILQAQNSLQQARNNLTVTVVSYAQKLLEMDVLTGDIKKKIAFDPEILLTKNPEQISEALLQSEIQQQ